MERHLDKLHTMQVTNTKTAPCHDCAILLVVSTQCSENSISASYLVDRPTVPWQFVRQLRCFDIPDVDKTAFSNSKKNKKKTEYQPRSTKSANQCMECDTANGQKRGIRHTAATRSLATHLSPEPAVTIFPSGDQAHRSNIFSIVWRCPGVMRKAKGRNTTQ